MIMLAWQWQYSIALRILEALFFSILAIRKPVILVHLSNQLLIPSVVESDMVSFPSGLKVKDAPGWLPESKYDLFSTHWSHVQEEAILAKARRIEIQRPHGVMARPLRS